MHLSKNIRIRNPTKWALEVKKQQMKIRKEAKLIKSIVNIEEIQVQNSSDVKETRENKSTSSVPFENHHDSNTSIAWSEKDSTTVMSNREKKRAMKRKLEANESTKPADETDNHEIVSPKKKKKKSHKHEISHNCDMDDSENEGFSISKEDSDLDNISRKKKKKKKHNKEEPSTNDSSAFLSPKKNHMEENDVPIRPEYSDTTSHKKKKKHNKEEQSTNDSSTSPKKNHVEENDVSIRPEDSDTTSHKKKKKQKKDKELLNDTDPILPHKSKKHTHDNNETPVLDNSINTSHKKKKKHDEEKELQNGMDLNDVSIAPDNSTTASHKKSTKEKSKKAPSTIYPPTVTLALPGSILANAQSLELKTLLASQIARALAVFQVAEVVVFDEESSLPMHRTEDGAYKVNVEKCMVDMQNTNKPNSSSLLAYLLQYVECPQYLRRSLFPANILLSKVGIMAPLAIPSHAKQSDVIPYREGVVISEEESPGFKGKISSKVDIGLDSPIEIKQPHPVNTRVTIRVDDGCVVSRYEPSREKGRYWGFTVRLVNGLSGVTRGCSFPDGSSAYDHIIGTSERGTSVDVYEVPSYKHLLILFGGVLGLEHSLKLDRNLSVSSPGDLCDAYLNTCPDQGSRTIRTEEAIFISLSALRPKIEIPIK